MNILFITSGSIGDAIISSGIFNYLADQYPQARFTVAGGPAAVSVFEAFPRLDRIIKIIKQPRNRHWLTLWQEVRGQKWDIVVDLRGSALSYLLRAKRRYVFFRPDKSKSKAQQLALMMRLPAPPPTRLWSSAEAKANAEKLLPAGKQIILLAPKTNSEAKDWPIERFAELAKRLCTPNTVFVVLAAQVQKESVQPIIEALPKENVLDLSGVTDLLTAYAIMERSQLFIGNDSGLLHMAAASGIRCVGLYGPSNDKVYAPRGPHVTIVKSYDFAMGEKEKRDNKYMQMISVDQVEQAVRSAMHSL
ncbi:MAG TPA: glycosyltransferase family 9 protein [Rickettsiales bacterium]|nr:glycosyltransferase family 9 protein [Rickettsiales bacterium]